MEAYKAAGASVRLLNEVATNAVVKMSMILPVKETDRLVVLTNRINDIASKAESQMYTDHPELSAEFTDVFYGNLSDEPRTDVDAEVIQLAKEQMENRFNRKLSKN